MISTLCRRENLLLTSVIGSCILALSAQIAIPIPFSPVPFTMQTAAVLFLSLFWGSKRSVCSVLLYLLEGAMGLPVFSHLSGGILMFASPRGGYFLGFLVAAYIASKIAEKGKILFALIAAIALIHFFGVLHLASFIGLKNALISGSLVFIPGEMIKIFFLLRIFKSKEIYKAKTRILN